MYNGGTQHHAHLVLILLDLRTQDCGRISGHRVADTSWSQILANQFIHYNQYTQFISTKKQTKNIRIHSTSAKTTRLRVRLSGSSHKRVMRWLLPGCYSNVKHVERERDENKLCDGHFERSTRVTCTHTCEFKMTRDHRSNLGRLPKIKDGSNMTTKLVIVLHKDQLM